jgi:hypothetical protein
MIVVSLKDGTKRALDKAEVVLGWEVPHAHFPDVKVIDQFTLADVIALLLIEPEMGAMPGKMGGMPIVGLAFTDASDLRVEVPLPLDFAEAVGRQLIEMVEAVRAGTAQVYRTMPGGLEGGG